MINVKVYFKRLIPHFCLIFAFVTYVCLGGVGFYYILKPYYNVNVHILKQNAVEIATHLKHEQVSEDYIELTPDCPCGESKIIIDNPISENHRNVRESHFATTEKWTFIDALVLSFDHMTTIGTTEFHFESKFIKLFALAFTFFGVIIAFITLADLSFLFHEAVYLTINRIIRCCCCCCSKNPSRSRSSLLYNPMKPAISVHFTKRVNPLVFVAILLTYCTICGFGFDYLSSKKYFSSFFDCFFIIFGISTKSLLLIPRHWFFVQLLYIFMGFIIVGALMRSTMPILEKLYGRHTQTVRIIEHVTVPNKVLTMSQTVFIGGNDSSNLNTNEKVSAQDLLLYSIASDSIPYADDKMSTVASSAMTV